MKTNNISKTQNANINEHFEESFEPGRVVYFKGPFNTKILGYITDVLYINDKAYYNVDIGRSCFVKAAKSESLLYARPISENKPANLNKLYIDKKSGSIVRVMLNIPSGYYLVKEICSDISYISESLDELFNNIYNKKIIDWSNEHKGQNAIIKYGKDKGRTVTIIGYAEQFHHIHRFNGFFVNVLYNDKLSGPGIFLPDELEIKI